MDSTVPFYSTDPISGLTIVTYPDGTAQYTDPEPLQQQISPSPQPIQEVTHAPDTSGSYAPRSYAPRHSYPSPGGYAGGPSYQPPPVHFADGSAPGQPRGAAPERGGDFRQQVSVPGGAAAGPFETRSAYPPSNRAYGGTAASGGGGGGGHTSPLYDKVRAKGMAMASKVRGMASGVGGGGGYSASGPSYSSSSYKPYEPEEEKMHGRYAKGLDPDQAAGLAYRPTMMIPRVFGGNLDIGDPVYSQLSELPAYAMALLGKRNLKGGLSPVTNQLGKVYQRAGTSGDVPSIEEMVRNLAHAKKGSAVGELFGGIKAGKGSPYPYEYGHEPLSAASSASQMESLLLGAFKWGQAPQLATRSSLELEGLLDRWGSKAMKHKPGHGKPIYRYVGKRLMR